MTSKVTYKLKLTDFVDTDGLTRSEKTKLKNEVGEFLIDKILEDTSKQKSAVTGDKWKALNKDYKKRKSKIAPGVANLELTGKMLDALEVKNRSDGIEIGIFKASEAGKADGHCNHSGKSKLPLRRFIPKEGETFRSGIMKQVVSIAQDILDESEEKAQEAKAKILKRAMAAARAAGEVASES